MHITHVFLFVIALILAGCETTTPSKKSFTDKAPEDSGYQHKVTAQYTYYYVENILGVKKKPKPEQEAQVAELWKKEADKVCGQNGYEGSYEFSHNNEISKGITYESLFGTTQAAGDEKLIITARGFITCK